MANAVIISDGFDGAAGTAITAHQTIEGDGWFYHPAFANALGMAISGSELVPGTNNNFLLCDREITESSTQVITALVRCQSSSSRFGLIAYAQVPDFTFYYARWSSPVWEIRRATGSGTTTVEVASSTAVPGPSNGQSYDLRFELSPGSQKLFVNDVLAVSGTDVNLTAPGMAGIYNNGGFYYKDFYVSVPQLADTVPPSPITDLTASAVGQDVRLNFTNTGNDGSEGTATQFDVRYSVTAITDDADFQAATPASVLDVPALAGTPEAVIVSGLGAETLYYFAVKVGDQDNNWSAMSNVVTATTGTDGTVQRIFPSASGTWSWHQRPQAIRHVGIHDKTYIGWVDNAGNVKAGSYDHQSEAWAEFTLKTFSADDHNNPCFFVRQDGRIVALYSNHNDSALRWRISTNPEDISAFGSEKTFTTGSGFSYPQPVRLSAEGGKILVFFRRAWSATYDPNYDGNMTTAHRVWGVAESLDDLETLTNAPALWVDSSVNSPYTEPVGNGVDRIWFCRSDWQIGQLSYVRKDILSCYYQSGSGGVPGSFYRANGTKICDYNQLPITDRSLLDLVYDTDAVGGRYAFTKDIAIDAISGDVAMVFSTYNSGMNYFHYARMDNATKTYSSVEIVHAGDDYTEDPNQPAYDGGIVLNHENINQVYLCREVTSGTKHFEVERWDTADAGATFLPAQYISADYPLLPAKLHRPFAPWNHHDDMPVIFAGAVTYTTFTTYDSQIFAVIGASASTITETLDTLITSISSPTDRQAYRETVDTLITSGATVDAVTGMVEALLSLGVSASTVGDVQGYADGVSDTIVSASDTADAQDYVDDLADTLVSTSDVTDTTGAPPLAESLLTTAISASNVSAAQAYVDTVTALAVSASNLEEAIELGDLVEQLGTVAESISAVSDRQLYYDNVAIVAISTSSITAVGAYIEQVSAAAVSASSLNDVLVGSFVGRYVFADYCRPRSFVDYCRPRGRRLQ